MKRLARLMPALLGCAVLVATAIPADAAEKVIKPFNGENLDGWTTKGKKHHWTVGTAALDPDNPKQLVVKTEGDELVNAGAHGSDIYSKATHGDAVIRLEVMVPKGSNSGIYVHGEYEIQVLDSWGKEHPGGGDMGAVYGAAPPTDPVYKKPGEWSTYEIHFRTPRFDANGKKTANARLEKVVLNGKVIHEDLELKGSTPGGVTGKEKPKGPIMFQGNHGPVAYRNLIIRPVE